MGMHQKILAFKVLNKSVKVLLIKVETSQVLTLHICNINIKC